MFTANRVEPRSSAHVTSANTNSVSYGIPVARYPRYTISPQSSTTSGFVLAEIRASATFLVGETSAVDGTQHLQGGRENRKVDP